MKDFIEMFIFADDLYVFEIKGWKIKRFFEESYVELPNSRGGFIVPSRGTAVELDLSKSKLKRVRSLKLND